MIEGTYKDLLQILQKEAATLNLSLFVVGGGVRDLLGEKPFRSNDIDLVLDGEVSTLAKRVTSIVDGKLQKFTSFMSVKVELPSKWLPCKEIDIARARSEYYERGGALPTVTAASVVEDLKRRDFSINAMALSLEEFIDCIEKGHLTLQAEHAILDFFNGKQDLKFNQIRVLHDKSFLDDPTRIFRGCRYSVRIGGAFEKKTERLLVEGVETGALKTVSGTRLIKEIQKITVEKDPVAIFYLLDRYDVFRFLDLVDARSINDFLHSLNDLVIYPLEERFLYFMARAYSFATSEQRVGYQLKYQLGKKFIKKCVDLCSSGK